MNSNFVEKVTKANGYPVIRHSGTGGVYRIKELIKTKVNGAWEKSAIYYGRSGKYCRMINDFGNFEYLHNEELL